MESNNWTGKEFEMVDLGDDRLNQRLIKISQQILESPQSNINKACGDWSETKAAYRFFQNDNVNYQDIIEVHAQMTKKRAEQEETILAIQDTTYYNYTHHPKTEGLGVLSRFKGKHKDEILTIGLCMHTTLGITTEGLPLGILDQNIFSREELPKEKKELKKKSHNTALPIEEKESIRWLDSMRQTASRFEQENKKVVTIADREADIYAIHIFEKRPPKGCAGIEWMLLTNIPVLIFADAVEKIKWYCLRWRIEVYFKVIKSGFKVEDCRLESSERLIRYLAVVSIVAWRVYWLTLVSRTAPDISASLLLNDFDWKILFAKFNPNKKIPKHPPTMKQITIWIAQLGGFLARKGDGEPGVTHIWRGLKKLANMIEGAQMFKNVCG